MGHRSTTNNPDICRLLRCSLPELRRLKLAFKAELQEAWAGGGPFFGQLPSESDPDGAIREELWEAVARKDGMLQSLLRGGRYLLKGPPRSFSVKLQAAKEKIFLDLNTAVRRGRRIGRRQASRTSEDGSLAGGHWQLPLGQSSRQTGSSQMPDDERSASPTPGVGGDEGEDERPLSQRRSSSSLAAAAPFQLQCSNKTLPNAIKRIEELEVRLEMLEQQHQRHDGDVNRVMQRVGAMFAERDRLIERLRWYL